MGGILIFRRSFQFLVRFVSPSRTYLLRSFEFSASTPFDDAVSSLEPDYSLTFSLSKHVLILRSLLYLHVHGSLLFFLSLASATLFFLLDFCILSLLYSSGFGLLGGLLLG